MRRMLTDKLTKSIKEVVNAYNSGEIGAKVEVANITAIDGAILTDLKAGDIVVKQTGDMRHTYVVTYKEENKGICMSYFDAGYLETVSYDYVTNAWVYNSTDIVNITDDYALKSEIPASVSGTNDGTNWTSLTVGNDTYGLASGGGGVDVISLPDEYTQSSGSITSADWNKLLNKETIVFTYNGDVEKVTDTYIYFRTTANNNKWVDYLSNQISSNQDTIIQKRIRFKGPNYPTGALTYTISTNTVAEIPTTDEIVVDYSTTDMSDITTVPFTQAQFDLIASHAVNEDNNIRIKLLVEAGPDSVSTFTLVPTPLKHSGVPSLNSDTCFSSLFIDGSNYYIISIGNLNNNEGTFTKKTLTVS